MIPLLVKSSDEAFCPKPNTQVEPGHSKHSLIAISVE